MKNDWIWIAYWALLGMALACIALTTTVTYRGHVVYKGYWVK